ncbi:hypothetical protein QZH41_016901 [Actinostola sp. cb2023]|nr:hypothetical protein QZH41_016901 [Actinostola sp. cb2023]
MKICVSNNTTLKKLDSFAVKFDEDVQTLNTTTQENCDESAGSSFKVVLDNIDLNIRTRDMTAERQNKDIHWVNHSAVMNRVIPDEHFHRVVDLLEIDNIQFLPSLVDHEKIRRDYTHLVERILVEHLPCMQFLQTVCPLHIPHKYSKEMSQKTQKIPLGVILKNENKSEEMLDILTQIQGYSTIIPNASGEMKYKPTPVIGDQLTVERGVNIIEAVQNSYTSEEKLEGIHMEIADWHAVVTFLNVSLRDLELKI